jgi:hypothetical protein
MLLNPAVTHLQSDVPHTSSSHVFIPSHSQPEIEKLITLGTNELAADQARWVLLSALHGTMGCIPPWNRNMQIDRTCLSRRDTLTANSGVLSGHGIDVKDEDNLDLLAGAGFQDYHLTVHRQYVYLIAAHLINTEHLIASDTTKALLLAVFTFITGHRRYEDALHPLDRRIVTDSGIHGQVDPHQRLWYA